MRRRPAPRRIALAAATAVVITTGIGYHQSLAAPSARNDQPEPAAAVAPAPNAPPPAPAVHSVTAAELGDSWHPGCPVEPERLRRVELDYVGRDGDTHRGSLVVHENRVAEVIAIFEALQQIRYPIAKMQTVDHYPGAEDELSMRDNNTSAFNCRRLPGGTGWSLHAYGRAIDVNPLVNPYIDSSGDLQPATAGRYLDRGLMDPEMLKPGDPAVRAFTDRGWRWGGAWRNPVDYQHFEI